MKRKIYLNVPYKEKDEAKILGAKWDSSKKRWFYKGEMSNIIKFGKWLLPEDTYSKSFVFDCLYLVFAKRTCFRCKKETLVVGLVASEGVMISDEDTEPREFFATEFNYPNMGRISGFSKSLPQQLLNLVKQYGVYENYSKIAGKTLCNHCSHCNILQGNNHVFDESDTPFSPIITTEDELIEKVKSMKLLPIKFKFDYGMYLDIDLEDMNLDRVEDYLLEYAERLPEFFLDPIF